MDYSSTPLNGSTPSNAYSAQPPLGSQLYGANSVPPREMWNPPLTTGRSAQQPQQQQNNMNLGARRAGPATPAVLSSYATAMAQPQLANKFTQPPPSAPAGYADYHPSAGLRGGAPQEDLSRYPAVDRAVYSSGASTIGRLGGAPLTRTQPHQGYYPGSSALQYPGSGLNASSPQNYAQQQHVGAPSNYYGSGSAGPLHPIEPDMIFQVVISTRYLHFSILTKFHCFVTASNRFNSSECRDSTRIDPVMRSVTATSWWWKATAERIWAS